jgi:GAF domain-containing protein
MRGTVAAVRDWLRGLPARLVEGVLGGVLLIGLIALAAFVDDDFTLPVWLAAVLLALVLVGGVALGARLGRRNASPEDYAVEVLAQYLEDEAGLERYPAAHLSEVLATLRLGFSGHLDVTYGDLIGLGVLQPARDLLSAGDDVRLSVLTPDETEKQFRMAFSAGHALASMQQFSLNIAGSFAGLAYARAELEWSNDVDDDPRFEAHPLARPGREYASIASMPIMVGTEVHAVLNVISTRQNAFSSVDLIYISLLGSVLSLAWGFMESSDGD